MVFGVTCTGAGSSSSSDGGSSSTIGGGGGSSHTTIGITSPSTTTTTTTPSTAAGGGGGGGLSSYGAVGESDTVTLLSSVASRGAAVYSSSSGGGSASDDSDDGGSVSSCGGGLLHHESCYQRQPLLPTHHHKSHHNNAGAGGGGDSASSFLGAKLAAKLSGSYHDGGSGPSTSSGGPSNFFNTTAATAVSAVNGLVKIQMPSPHRDEPRFPKEKLKTLWSVLFMLFNAALTTTSLALTHEQVPQNDPPLPDLVLDSFPVQQWGLDVSEMIILGVVYFSIIIVIFHKHRFIVFRRIFLILGLLYFYRSITMYVTVLPVANPSYYCSPKLNHTTALITIKRSLQLLSGFGLSINGHHTFCGDYIFSGHTTVLVLAYLVIKEYTPRRWWLLHWLYALLAATGVIMVLLARGHYTVDCIIAYYITTRLWYMYHTMANNPNLKESGQHNYFSRMWWFPVFRYFEGNVGGCVPRHYEWPLPWPRRWGVKLPQRTS